MIMKLFFLVISIFISNIIYSQNTVFETKQYSKEETKEQVNILKGSAVKRQGEKIQITRNGVVLMQQDYTPEYPINQSIFEKNESNSIQ